MQGAAGSISGIEKQASKQAINETMQLNSVFSHFSAEVTCCSDLTPATSDLK